MQQVQKYTARYLDLIFFFTNSLFKNEENRSVNARRYQKQQWHFTKEFAMFNILNWCSLHNYVTLLNTPVPGSQMEY